MERVSDPSPELCPCKPTSLRRHQLAGSRGPIATLGSAVCLTTPTGGTTSVPFRTLHQAVCRCWLARRQDTKQFPEFWTARVHVAHTVEVNRDAPRRAAKNAPRASVGLPADLVDNTVQGTRDHAHRSIVESLRTVSGWTSRLGGRGAASMRCVCCGRTLLLIIGHRAHRPAISRFRIRAPWLENLSRDGAAREGRARGAPVASPNVRRLALAIGRMCARQVLDRPSSATDRPIA